MKLKLTFFSLLALLLMAVEARAAEAVTLMVRTNGAIVGPTNFFTANADLINAVVVGGPGGGEANAGVNLGTNAGLYAGKSGLNLQFRSLRGTGWATTSTNSSNVVVDVTIPTSDGQTLGLLSAADFNLFSNATVNLTAVSNLLNLTITGLHSQSNAQVVQSNTLTLTITGLNVLSNGWLNTSNYVASLLAGVPVLSNQFVITSNTVVTLNAGLATLSNGVTVLSNGVVTLSNQVVSLTLYAQSVSNQVVLTSNAVVVVQGALNTFSNAMVALTNALGTAAFQPSGAFAAASHTHSTGDIASGQFSAARLPNDIIVFNRVYHGSTAGASETWSNGVPEGQIIAKIGSKYWNTNAAAAATNVFWVKVLGDGLATGWTNVFGSGGISSGGVTVGAAYNFPGDGAISTNGNALKLFTAYDTNILKVVLTGDSWMYGAAAWPAKIFGPSPIVPGWNTLLLYTNFSESGTSLRTNEYTNAHAVRPITGQIGILITCFGMNSDGQTSEVTETNQYAYYDMARADNYYIIDQTIPVRTNASAAEKLKTYRLNQSKRMALATGKIHGLVDVDRYMGHLVLDQRYFSDGIHLGTLGNEMLAYFYDSLLRSGLRRSTHPMEIYLRAEVANSGTNMNIILPNYYTGQALFTIDAQNGDIAFPSKVTGNIGTPVGWGVFGSGSLVTNGTGLVTRILPKGFTITSVLCTLAVASSSGPVTVDVKAGGTTIFSTLPSIDQGEQTSATGTPGTLSTTSISALTTITVDVTASGTGGSGTGGAYGLDFWFIGHWQQ